MTEHITFKQLQIDGWRQFDKINIALHPAVTVLTGANGAGKSTLLNIFTKHFGWDRPYLATPVTEMDGAIRYLTGLLMRVTGAQSSAARGHTKIGLLSYSNGSEAALQVPPSVGSAYKLEMPGQQHVQGIHIPSHSAQPRYQRVEQISTSPVNPENSFGAYVGEQQSRYQGAGSGYSPVYRLKESLIAMAMFGEGNKYVKADPEILKVYLGFIETLKRVLPKEFGFKTIEIRIPEVVLVTESGSWPVDSASGGIMSVIDIVWQIYLFRRRNGRFVVTMDEPENHLHPSMQRSLLASLMEAFPEVQFIVATHSPFIVSSVQDSNVYVLKFERLEDAIQKDQGETHEIYKQRVRSIFLQVTSKAGNANEILREVLGVRATVPLWVESKLASIVEAYRLKPFTNDTLVKLRNELAELGFDELYPDALDAIVRKK